MPLSAMPCWIRLRRALSLSRPSREPLAMAGARSPPRPSWPWQPAQRTLNRARPASTRLFEGLAGCAWLASRISSPKAAISPAQPKLTSLFTSAPFFQSRVPARALAWPILAAGRRASTGRWLRHRRRGKTCLFEPPDEARVPTQIAQKRLSRENHRIGALFDNPVDPFQRRIMVAERGMDGRKMDRRGGFALRPPGQGGRGPAGGR